MKTLNHILACAAILFVSTFAASSQTSLPSLNGGNVDVQAQRGKVVVLAVGASWLPLSSKQAEYTNTLAKKYAGKNVAVFFILTDSTNPKSKNHATDEHLRNWASSKGLTVSVLRDSEGSATLKKFGIDQLPSFVILDKGGQRSGNTFGGISPGFDITVEISKKVDSLL